MVEITILKRPRTEVVVTQRKFFKKTARGKVIKGMKIHELNASSGILMLRLQFFASGIFATMYLAEYRDVENAKRCFCLLQEIKHIHLFRVDILFFLTQTSFYLR
jgi:hypothetical protein